MSKKSFGFTLIELLVVISIIAILSAVGLVTFTNVRKSTMDAKIKSDLNAIKKAYEANYDATLNGGQGGYKQLSADGISSTYFADGKLPKQPGGTSYTFAYGPDAAAPNNKTDGYRVSSSTTLSDGTTPTVVSNQGTAPVSQLNSCDPGNTLSNGLVEYWKMDGNANTSVGSYNASVAGSVPFVSSENTAGNFNQAASFDGNSANHINPPSNFSFASATFSQGFTITAWVKPANLSGRKTIYNNGHGVSFAVENANIVARLHTSVAWYTTGGGSITTGWSFVALVYNPTTTNRTATLYKNGSSAAGSVTLNQAYSDGGGNDRIGGSDPSFGTFPFNGLIDDLRIYNKQLTQAELSLLAGGCTLP